MAALTFDDVPETKKVGVLTFDDVPAEAPEDLDLHENEVPRASQLFQRGKTIPDIQQEIIRSRGESQRTNTGAVTGSPVMKLGEAVRVQAGKGIPTLDFGPAPVQGPQKPPALAAMKQFAEPAQELSEKIEAQQQKAKAPRALPEDEFFTPREQALEREMKKPAPYRTGPEEVGAALWRGFGQLGKGVYIDTPASILQIGADLIDRLLPKDERFDDIRKTSEGVTGTINRYSAYVEKAFEAHPLSRTSKASQDDWWRRQWTTGVEQAPQTTSSILLAMLGQPGLAAAQFGLGRYAPERFKAENVHGLPRGQSVSRAAELAAMETGTEYLGNLAELATLGVLSKPATKAITINAMRLSPLKTVGRMMGVIGEETGEELANTLDNWWRDRRDKIPDTVPLMQQLIDTAVVTAISMAPAAVGTAGGQHITMNEALGDLKNPKIDKSHRLLASQALAGNIGDEDLRNAFYDIVVPYIAAGQPIPDNLTVAPGAVPLGGLEENIGKQLQKMKPSGEGVLTFDDVPSESPVKPPPVAPEVERPEAPSEEQLAARKQATVRQPGPEVPATFSTGNESELLDEMHGALRQAGRGYEEAGRIIAGTPADVRLAVGNRSGGIRDWAEQYRVAVKPQPQASQPAPAASEAVSTETPPEDQKGGKIAPVAFHSIWPNPVTGKVVEQYSMTDDFGDFKKGSTLTREGIEKAGFTVPEPESAKAKTAADEYEKSRRKPSPKVSTEVLGGNFESVTPKENRTVRGKYAVVDAATLVTSDDEGYDQELQNRNRATQASREQIEEIAGKLDPLRLGESRVTDGGAPLVDDTLNVIAGNGRTKAIRIAYDRDSPQGKAYRDWVVKNAAAFGVKPGPPGRMKRPVLVRVVDDYGDIDKYKLAELSNRPQVAGFGEGEQAANDAKLLSSILHLFQPSEEGDVLAASNRDFLNAFINATGARQELLQGNEYNNVALRRRVQNALLASIVGTDDLNLLGDMTAAAEELKIKRIVNGLMMSAPSLVQFNDSPYGLGDMFRKAMKKLVALRRDGLSVDQFMQQIDALAPDSDKDVDMLLMLNILGKARSEGYLVDGFKRYAEFVKQQPPAEGDLLGATPADRRTIVEAAFREPPDESGGAPGRGPKKPTEPKVSPPEPGVPKVEKPESHKKAEGDLSALSLDELKALYAQLESDFKNDWPTELQDENHALAAKVDDAIFALQAAAEPKTADDFIRWMQSDRMPDTKMLKTGTARIGEILDSLPAEELTKVREWVTTNGTPYEQRFVIAEIGAIERSRKPKEEAPKTESTGTLIDQPPDAGKLISDSKNLESELGGFDFTVKEKGGAYYTKGQKAKAAGDELPTGPIGGPGAVTRHLEELNRLQKKSREQGLKSLTDLEIGRLAMRLGLRLSAAASANSPNFPSLLNEMNRLESEWERRNAEEMGQTTLAEPRAGYGEVRWTAVKTPGGEWAVTNSKDTRMVPAGEQLARRAARAMNRSLTPRTRPGVVRESGKKFEKFDPANIGKLSRYFAGAIAEKSVTQAQIEAALMNKYGPAVQPYLLKIYNQAAKLARDAKIKADHDTTGESIIPEDGKPVVSVKAARAIVGAGDRPTNSGEIRPGLRVADGEAIPEPAEFVTSRDYNGYPRPHQIFASNLLLTTHKAGKGGFMESDGVGVGKTIPILIALDRIARQTGKPVLLVVPAGLRDQINEGYGSYYDAAKAMGIDLKRFEIGSYEALTDGKIGKRQYAAAVFDEAHKFKNFHSQRSGAMRGVRADFRVFATATPLDRPSGAAYFVSDLTGEPMEDVMLRFGLEFHPKVDSQGRPLLDDNQQPMFDITPIAGLTWADVRKNMLRERTRMIGDGTLLRREFPFFGRFDEKTYPMTAEDQRMHDDWKAEWERVIAKSKGFGRARLKGQMTFAGRRLAESMKIPLAERLVDEFLANNPTGKIVLVGEGTAPALYRSTKVEVDSEGQTLPREARDQVPQLLGEMEKALKKKGIKFAKIFGPGSAAGEIAKWQNDDTVRVMLMSAKKGGVGISADDTKGNQPREVHIFSMDMGGDNIDQLHGRFSRLFTESPTSVHYHYLDGHHGDIKSQEIGKAKLEVLRLIQRGEDPDVARPMYEDDEVGNILYEKSAKYGAEKKLGYPSATGEAAHGKFWLSPKGEVNNLVNNDHLDTANEILGFEDPADEQHGFDVLMQEGWLRAVTETGADGRTSVMVNGSRDLTKSQRNTLEIIAHEKNAVIVRDNEGKASDRIIYDPEHAEAAGMYVRESSSETSGQPSQAGVPSAAEIQSFVEGQEIPADKQKEAVDGISRTVQQIEASRAREGGGSYSQGVLDIGLPASEAQPGKKPAKASAVTVQREGEAISQGGEALREVLAAKGSASSIIPALIRRKLPTWNVVGTKIENPADAFAAMWAVRTPYFESFKVMVLSDDNVVMGCRIISVGSRNASIVEPEMLIAALHDIRDEYGKKYNKMIIGHNHPSGDPTPSSEDIAITKRLEKVTEKLGYAIVDHVITNGDKYVSLRELGLSEGQSATERPPQSILKASVVMEKVTPPPSKAAWETVVRSALKMMDAPGKIAELIRPLRNDDPSAGHILYLTTKHSLGAIERVPNMMQLSETELWRKIFDGVVKQGVTSVIVDISPSGASPSSEAIRMMKQLQKKGETANIAILDGVGISDASNPSGYYSLKEFGLLEKPNVAYGGTEVHEEYGGFKLEGQTDEELAEEKRRQQEREEREKRRKEMEGKISGKLTPKAPQEGVGQKDMFAPPDLFSREARGKYGTTGEQKPQAMIPTGGENIVNTGITFAAANAAVKEANKKLAANIRVVTVREAVAAAGEEVRNVQGFYYNGQVFIIPDNVEIPEGMTDHQAAILLALRVLSHEGVHQGLAVMMRDPKFREQFQAAADAFPDSLLGKLDLEKYQMAHPQWETKGHPDRAKMLGEYIAQKAGDAEFDKDRKASWYVRAMNAVKAWLRRTWPRFFPSDKSISDQVVEDYIFQARRGVRKAAREGVPTSAEGEAPVAMKKTGSKSAKVADTITELARLKREGKVRPEEEAAISVPGALEIEIKHEGETPIPVTLGNLDMISPIPMPELLELARELAFDPKMTNRLRSALGRFKHGMLDAEIDISRKAQSPPLLLAKVLAHEIGHGADWLEHKTLKRGNVIGRLISFTDKWLKNTFPPGFLESATNKELREELIALTHWWTPWDEKAVSSSYNSYRKGSDELYAEFLSVVLNAPGEARARAPKFYDLFFKYLEHKPSVAGQFMRLQNLIANPTMLGEHRDIRITEMFKNAEYETRRLHQIAEAGRKSVWFMLKHGIAEKNLAGLEARSKILRSGRMNPDVDIRYSFEENDLLPIFVQGALRNLQPILNEIDDQGLRETVSKILFLERIAAGDRWEFANPLGYTPAEADRQIQWLRKNDPEGFEKAQRLVERFHDWVYEEGTALMAEDVFTPEQAESTEKTKQTYATYRVTKHIKDWVSAGIIEQKGTFEDVGDPLTATVMKVASMVRAARRNQFKKEVGNVLLQNAATLGDVELAKVVTIPGRPPEVKPHRNPNLAPIMWRESGKWKAAYVDRYIAEQFNRVSSTELSTMARTLRAITGNPAFRQLYITLNLGFQSANFIRDMLRTWKSHPDISFLDLVKGYAKTATWKQAVKRVSGEFDPEVVEKEKAGAFNVTLNELIRTEHADDAELQAFMRKFGIGEHEYKPEWKTIPGIREALALMEAIEFAGNVIETVPKIVAWDSLLEIPERERAYVVRNMAGTPNPKRRGGWYAVSNNVFLFSNMGMQGIRADASLATQPKTAAGWWWKTAAIGLIPKLLMAAALFGFFGQKKKKEMEMASEYERSNYSVFPIGETPNGDGIRLTLPMDESSRLISGLFWKVLTRMDDPEKFVREIFSFTGSHMPFVGGPAPGFTIAANWYKYMTGGEPRDTFRDQPILTEDEMKARGLDGLMPMVWWTVNQNGLTRFDIRDTLRPEKPLWQKTLALTPGVNRFIRVGAYGETEGLRETVQGVQQQEAKERIQRRRDLGEVAREGGNIVDYARTEAGSLSEAKEIVRSGQRLGVRLQNDVVAKALLSTTSQAQQLAVLKRSAEDYDTETEFRAYITSLLQNRVIGLETAQRAVVQYRADHPPAAIQSGAK